jgi:serine/threonine protein kinase
METIHVTADGRHCTLTSFEHSRIVPVSSLSSCSTSNPSLDLKIHQIQAQPWVATIPPAYVAPEVFATTTDMEYPSFDGYASDVWSLGVVLFVMILGTDAMFVIPTADDDRFRKICIQQKLNDFVHYQRQRHQQQQLMLQQQQQDSVQHDAITSSSVTTNNRDTSSSRGLGLPVPPELMSAESTSSIMTLGWSQLPPFEPPSDMVIDLIQGMLHVNPMERLMLEQIVMHPWVQQS